MPPIIQAIIDINKMSNAHLDAAEKNLKLATKTLKGVGVK